MSQFTNDNIISVKQETAIAPYRIVKVGTVANSVIEATDATAPLLGISSSVASDTAGEPIGIYLTGGTAKVEASAAIAVGAKLTATTGGTAVTTTTAEDFAIGEALEAATAAGDIIECTIAPYVYPTA